MKLKIPAGLYDAMVKIQQHCAKHDNTCDKCCFNNSHTRGEFCCILRRVPEDWTGTDIERINNTVRPRNFKKGGKP